MSRSFLTGINLNKNELLNARIQNLATAPSSPVAGQIYYDTEDNTLRYYNGTSWLTLAQGGDLAGAISAAIDELTTDDIEEGSSNLYYTDTRAKDDAATLLTGATLTNITITGDGTGLTITAENGVADSTTDDLTEGTTNLYFTDQRALDATSAAYDTAGTAQGIVDALDTDDIEEGTSNLYFTDQRALDATASAYDAAGAAAAAQSAAEDYADGLASNYDAAGAAATALSDAQAYADALVQGLNVKDSVRTASTADIDLTTDTPSTIGGVSIANGDRVLLKDQSPATENGIYVYNSTAKRLTRAEDQDAPEKGDYALVVEGTYAATGWLVSNADLLSVSWTQFSAANEYTAGSGVSITANAIGVVTGTGLTVNGSNELTFASGYGIKKYTALNPELTPTDGVVTWTVTHSIGTAEVLVQVYDKLTGALVEVDVVRTSSTVVTLSWVAAATVSASAYTVTVIG
jgi:hypothetical protein